MRKSAKNSVITYLTGTKFPLNKMNISDKNTAKNSIPAAARISRSLSTGMEYPSTISPK
jgi:hypothetical protein